jgi:hypothetical protein
MLILLLVCSQPYLAFYLLLVCPKMANKQEIEGKIEGFASIYACLSK